MMESNPYKPPNQISCTSCGENYSASENHCPRCTIPENSRTLIRLWILGGTLLFLIGFVLYQLIKVLFVDGSTSQM